KMCRPIFFNGFALSVSIKIDEYASRVFQYDIISISLAVHIHSQWKGRRWLGHKNKPTPDYKHERDNRSTEFKSSAVMFALVVRKGTDNAEKKGRCTQTHRNQCDIIKIAD